MGKLWDWRLSMQSGGFVEEVKQQYYLLFYGKLEGRSKQRPKLTYCVMIGDLTDDTAESIANKYEISRCSQSGNIQCRFHGFVPNSAQRSADCSAEGIFTPFCAMYPLQLIPKDSAVDFFEATLRFNEDDRSGVDNDAIRTIRQIIQLADGITLDQLGEALLLMKTSLAEQGVLLTADREAKLKAAVEVAAEPLLNAYLKISKGKVPKLKLTADQETKIVVAIGAVAIPFLKKALEEKGVSLTAEQEAELTAIIEVTAKPLLNAYLKILAGKVPKLKLTAEQGAGIATAFGVIAMPFLKMFLEEKGTLKELTADREAKLIAAIEVTAEPLLNALDYRTPNEVEVDFALR